MKRPRKLKTYIVHLQTEAVMSGSIEVEAFDKREAEKKALKLSGDVSWNYEGTIDDRLEVIDCELT